MSQLKDPAKYTAWQKRISRFQASGLTVAAFCRREEVSAASFHYWARRIRSLEKKHEPIAAREAGNSASDSVSAMRPLVEFWLHESVRILVPADCPEAISRVLRCLQAEYERPSSHGAFQRV